MIDNCNSQKSIKESIRIIFVDENDKPLKLKQRNNNYTTTVDFGYEDLDLREDSTKISLYQTSEHIELWGSKRFKVLKRTFMPCCPVCLYLTLKEE